MRKDLGGGHYLFYDGTHRSLVHEIMTAEFTPADLTDLAGRRLHALTRHPAKRDIWLASYDSIAGVLYSSEDDVILLPNSSILRDIKPEDPLWQRILDAGGMHLTEEIALAAKREGIPLKRAELEKAGINRPLRKSEVPSHVALQILLGNAEFLREYSDAIYAVAHELVAEAAMGVYLLPREIVRQNQATGRGPLFYSWNFGSYGNMFGLDGYLPLNRYARLVGKPR
ncbi:hypothetical protein HYY70_00705 [Candidatus Woesearchaeota archaeon]|nr:hypothetical protein [Candidatus Woesearchaeota archaeon]